MITLITKPFSIGELADKKRTFMVRDIKTFVKLKQAAFNKEFTAIYEECRQPFLRTFIGKYPTMEEADLEEIYNDAALAFYNNVKNKVLTELTCSIQSYINRVGENKIIDFFRRNKVQIESLPEYETLDYCEKANEYWLADNDEDEQERKGVVFEVIKKLVEPCKKILYSFYYRHFTMEMIAESMGFNSSDVAKTKKSQCMSKVKRVAVLEFRNKGLI